MIPLAAAAVVLPAAAALVAWVRLRYLVATVDGPSMEPALRSGDRLLVRRTRRVRAGQIVVVRVRPPTLDAPPPDAAAVAAGDVPFEHDDPDGVLLVKRAIAVAGDPVPVDRVPSLRAAGATAVPPGAVVVLGDNPAASWDSRDYGFVHADQLVGVAVRPLPSR